VKVVATTLREVHSTSRHSWSAVAWVNGKTYTAPTAELEVVDRVGGGDGFAAGFIYGLLSGEAPEEAIRLGWAHGALLTTFPGDTTMATCGPGAGLRQRRIGAHSAVGHRRSVLEAVRCQGGHSTARHQWDRRSQFEPLSLPPAHRPE
jgi:hypothetical protein